MHPPNGALISDNDDSLILVNTESEGVFGGVYNADDDDVGLEGNIPHEGAQGPLTTLLLMAKVVAGLHEPRTPSKC